MAADAPFTCPFSRRGAPAALALCPLPAAGTSFKLWPLLWLRACGGRLSSPAAGGSASLRSACPGRAAPVSTRTQGDVGSVPSPGLPAPQLLEMQPPAPAPPTRALGPARGGSALTYPSRGGPPAFPRARGLLCGLQVAFRPPCTGCSCSLGGCGTRFLPAFLLRRLFPLYPKQTPFQ